MKVSLAWIFDHLKGNLNDNDINRFIENFNCTTAEIDYQVKVDCDLSSFALGVVVKNDAQTTLTIPEWNKEVQLESRKEAFPGMYFLVKKDGRTYRFATLRDVGSEKDGLMPALWVAEQELKGAWKDSCDQTDYIITIDNKSLNHRPDLWGHRGMAREVGAILNMELIAEEECIKPLIIKNYRDVAPRTPAMPFELAIKAPEMCHRLAGLYLEDVVSRASIPYVALRLARLDARPLDALVDATNYVMFDLGQPTHAFDADAIHSKSLTVQKADAQQKLTLLDGQTITLTPDDCIVSDGENPLSLAGIMGGSSSSITSKTKKVLLESANFPAAMIRKTAQRFKIRTESSTRFEKGLDPNQNTTALMRLIYLLDVWQIPHKVSKEIASIGALAQERIITVSSEMIAKKLGMNVSSENVTTVLKTLGFGIIEQSGPHGINYTVTVPTFRLKDCEIAEDLIEEIARSIGYDALPQALPMRAMRPLDNSRVIRIRDIKRQCAYGLGMNEIASYPLYDEDFLRVIAWRPENAAELSNPVSENWKLLVTSLIPHLLKAVELNKASGEALQFFEMAKTWRREGDVIVEKNMIGFVWYVPQGELDFYTIKAQLAKLGVALEMPLEWRKAEESAPWYQPHETAQLFSSDVALGFAGKINPVFMRRLAQGDAFIAELDAAPLIASTKQRYEFHAVSKYPRSDLDMSLLVPLSVSVAQLEEAIVTADGRICDVRLIDFFQKPEWKTEKSVTFRYVAVDEFRTLTKEDIEEIASHVRKAVENLGATVR